AAGRRRAGRSRPVHEAHRADRRAHADRGSAAEVREVETGARERAHGGRMGSRRGRPTPAAVRAARPGRRPVHRGSRRQCRGGRGAGDPRAGGPAMSGVARMTRSIDSTAPALRRASSVSKVYTMGDQTVRALDDVSLDIAAGEFVAIMGPSGSGKSTMMNLIGALDVPSTGSLAIDGRDISELSSDDLAELRNRTIGFVFQQFNLLPRTPALRQVMLPLLYANPKPADADVLARKRLQQVGL